MILRAENIVRRYGARTVVKGVSFQVGQGEIVGLLGPNGAGKTTSFYMVVGLIKPNEGSVFLDDNNITDEPMYRRAQLGVGYLHARLPTCETVAGNGNPHTRGLPKPDADSHRLNAAQPGFGKPLAIRAQAVDS